MAKRLKCFYTMCWEHNGVFMTGRQCCDQARGFSVFVLPPLRTNAALAALPFPLMPRYKKAKLIPTPSRLRHVWDCFWKQKNRGVSLCLLIRASGCSIGVTTYQIFRITIYYPFMESEREGRVTSQFDKTFSSTALMLISSASSVQTDTFFLFVLLLNLLLRILIPTNQQLVPCLIPTHQKLIGYWINAILRLQTPFCWKL